MKISKYKRELLFRKANGNYRIKDYRSKILSLFSINENDLVFIDLEETDKILSALGKMEHETTVDFELPLHELYNILKELKNDNSAYYIFIDRDWEYCGTFSIPSLYLLNENFTFGETITDDVLFVSVDLKKSILIDYYDLNGVDLIDIERRES